MRLISLSWTDIFENIEKNCLLKVISNIYIALLCFMLKSVINSIEIDKSLIDVVCY